jgi:NitT/TauT family transport system ATP-binding protein
MDEPFAALDEMTRFELSNDTLALWQAQQSTTIFVTHSVYKSMYLSNRVIVMAAQPGRVIADIAVEARYPRTDSFRNTPRYAELCMQGSQALQKSGDHHD